MPALLRPLPEAKRDQLGQSATRSRICRRSVVRVEALKEFFAGFEVRNNFARHSHLVAGARVAPDPLTPPPGGERPEAAQLDPIATCQGRADLLEHGVHDPLEVARVEMWVGGS